MYGIVKYDKSSNVSFDFSGILLIVIILFFILSGILLFLPNPSPVFPSFSALISEPDVSLYSPIFLFGVTLLIFIAP